MSQEDVKRKIARYLEDIRRIINDDGSFSDRFGLDVRLELLKSFTSLPNTLTEDEQFSVVEASVFEWRALDNGTPLEFEEILSDQIRKSEEQTLDEFTVVFFFASNLETKDIQDSFSSLDRTFLFRPNNELENELALSDLFKNAQRVLSRDVVVATLLPTVTTGRWRDAEAAIEETSKAFNLYRALINFKVSRHRYTLMFGPEHPLAYLLPSPVIGIFDSEGQYIEMYYESTLTTQYWPQKVEVAHFDSADRFVNFLVDKPPEAGSISQLIVEILLKYGEALDTNNWRVGFLALWQCLELATLQKTYRGKLASRVKVLLDNHKLSMDLVDHLSDVRNQLVHYGEFSQQGLLVFQMLKQVVESTLDALIAKWDILLDTKRLGEYYTYNSLDNTTLQRKREIISLILASQETQL